MESVKLFETFGNIFLIGLNFLEYLFELQIFFSGKFNSTEIEKIKENLMKKKVEQKYFHNVKKLFNPRY